MEKRNGFLVAAAGDSFTWRGRGATVPRMFTGLVQAVGEVVEVAPQPGGHVRLGISAPRWDHRPVAGESICVSGVCLTLAPSESRRPGQVLGFDVVAETLARTTLGRLTSGSQVNLERSVAASDLMGGHVVQGHVEGLARVEEVRTEGEYRLCLSAPAELMPCIVPKGSVTLDGVSLTIAAADPRRGTFEVALIPTTLELTTLSRLRPGDLVNLETDILARTTVHYLQNFAPRQA